MQQVVSSGAGKALLFFQIDAGCAVTEVGAASISNFDENKLGAIGHDQIDFTHARAIVLCGQA